MDDSELLALGKMYYDDYIRMFRAIKLKARTLPHSSHASRPSFDRIQEMINATFVETPYKYNQAKKRALIRDGYRCVVTGKYDQVSMETIKEVEEKFLSDPSGDIEYTQCAYIFSPSMSSSIESGSTKRDFAATIWAFMDRFDKALSDELNGLKVHRLENVMTLTHAFHFLFDQLKIWFAATEEKNKYKLEAANSYNLRSYPEYVTFKTSGVDLLPVPDPSYLAMHAACTKVAHLSGATKCIDKLYRDMEDTTTLDPNGASANTLEHAIFELQATGYEIIV